MNLEIIKDLSHHPFDKNSHGFGVLIFDKVLPRNLEGLATKATRGKKRKKIVEKDGMGSDIERLGLFGKILKEKGERNILVKE
ncbi:jg15399 [Pararge aegeria aegeria]|uniref:Jg15399 protein n=1 Tax=Pararge aegeria aegeria TaxID=348720 RepID=A0A8S4SAM7_9NEOP|nr:jg15399 [Pararge aegeria aegeria]